MCTDAFVWNECERAIKYPSKKNVHTQGKIEKNRKRAIWKIILSEVALENNFFSIQIKKKVPSMYYRLKDNFTRILKKIIKIGVNRTFFIPNWSSNSKKLNFFFNFDFDGLKV